MIISSIGITRTSAIVVAIMAQTLLSSFPFDASAYKNHRLMTCSDFVPYGTKF